MYTYNYVCLVLFPIYSAKKEKNPVNILSEFFSKKQLMRDVSTSAFVIPLSNRGRSPIYTSKYNPCNKNNVCIVSKFTKESQNTLNGFTAKYSNNVSLHLFRQWRCCSFGNSSVICHSFMCLLCFTLQKQAYKTLLICHLFRLV